MTATKTLQKIIKRDGSQTIFNKSKIENAVRNALDAVHGRRMANVVAAELLCKSVMKKLKSYNYSNNHQTHTSVELIQDAVEKVLLEENHPEVAKAYILYRHKQQEKRNEKMQILETDKQLDAVSKKFSTNSLKVLASRYLLRDTNHKIAETPSQLFERVAILVTISDIIHDTAIHDLYLSDDDSKNKNKNTDYSKSYLATQYLTKLDAFDHKFKIGKKFSLNKYHFRALVNCYITKAKYNNNMKYSFREVLQMLATGKFDKYAKNIQEYYDLMINQDFLPNTPTLMNAGAKLGQLSACFVLDIQDDLDDIMKTTHHTSKIFQSGGGVGINYSNIRPKGSIVASTSGVASGPVSFMNIINTVTEVVKQGGKRRGANMGIINISHPDIEEFITKKMTPGELENFNVSVGIWPDFWEHLEKNIESYPLRDPRTNEVVGQIKTRKLLDLITHSAWSSAEPGLLFFDNINRYNVFEKARGKPLTATNPCGEQSLYPYESCNLGSINISNFVVTDEKTNKRYLDMERLKSVIHKCTDFLDNIIDVNLYPLPEIDTASKESRRIGLGVMGVADALFKLGIPYNSHEGFKLQSEWAQLLTYESMTRSVEIARKRGAFSMYADTDYVLGKLPAAGCYGSSTVGASKYDWQKLSKNIQKYCIRNGFTTTVAPTGTLSMLADCSNGMEPAFALVYEKHVTVGKFYYANEALKQALMDLDIYSDELLRKIADNGGSVQGIDEIPADIQRIFVTAMDLPWQDHLKAQAVWQDWITNAIAKTINIPNDARVSDVEAAYVRAHELGLKGITVYRDGSRHKQVLHTPSSSATSKSSNEEEESSKTKIETKQKKKKQTKCPECSSELVYSESCGVCVDCGFSLCST